MSECVFMSKCVFYDQGWNEAPYCSKHRKYLDNGCGDCKPVTVDDMVTGNVVEVVRCKDCKWWDGIECQTRDIDVVDDDEYCSYGERKEQENE